ncbi:hypothetical protein D3C85_1139890 [compost metagenome]
MHQVHARLVDQSVGEMHLRRRNFEAPVATPVDGGHHPVSGALVHVNSRRQRLQALCRQVGQAGDAGAPGCGRPGGRDAAFRGAKAEHQQARAIGQRECGRSLGGLLVAPGPGAGHAAARQGRQRIGETFAAPVQHMVVGQYAAIDARREDGREVRRIHAVVDALGLRPTAPGHGGFQVDQAHLGPAPLQVFQCIAPDVGVIDRARQGAVQPFGQPHIATGILEVGLVQPRVAGMRQHRVDAARGHHVAGEKQLEALGSSGHRPPPGYQRQPKPGQVRLAASARRLRPWPAAPGGFAGPDRA